MSIQNTPVKLLWNLSWANELKQSFNKHKKVQPIGTILENNLYYTVIIHFIQNNTINVSLFHSWLHTMILMQDTKPEADQYMATGQHDRSMT